jgi:hypothetical protein
MLPKLFNSRARKQDKRWKNDLSKSIKIFPSKRNLEPPAPFFSFLAYIVGLGGPTPIGGV